MSFLDRIKHNISAVGKGAQKLSKIGQLKLDLNAAESNLSERFKALGKACANRIIDRGETSVDATEAAIATYIGEIREAQKRINEVRQELEETRSQ